MNDLAKIEGPQLTEKQRKLVEGILAGLSEDEAFAAAGYSENTDSKAPFRSVAVQEAIRIGCDIRLAGSLRAAAMTTMERLLEPQTPAATQFSAAKWVLEQGNAQAGKGKALTEMSEAELMGVIDRAAKQIADARDAGLIDVTPSNGA